jgi:hypothetical protein
LERLLRQAVGRFGWETSDEELKWKRKKAGDIVDSTTPSEEYVLLT